MSSPNKNRLASKSTVDRGIAETLEGFKMGRISFASREDLIGPLHRDAVLLALEGRLRDLENAPGGRARASGETPTEGPPQGEANYSSATLKPS